jgi:hypothetical protein
MEAACRVLSQLKSTKRALTEEQLAMAAWRRAVGKKVAQQSKPIGLVRDRLIVEVADAVWKSQLMTLQGQVLKRMEEVLGSRIVGQLEFRVAPPRREPARVEHHDHRASDDEADSILDPSFRSIYLASRRKASR